MSKYFDNRLHILLVSGLILSIAAIAYPRQASTDTVGLIINSFAEMIAIHFRQRELTVASFDGSYLYLIGNDIHKIKPKDTGRLYRDYISEAMVENIGTVEILELAGKVAKARLLDISPGLVPRKGDIAVFLNRAGRIGITEPILWTKEELEPVKNIFKGMLILNLREHANIFPVDINIESERSMRWMFSKQREKMADEIRGIGVDYLVLWGIERKGDFLILTGFLVSAAELLPLEQPHAAGRCSISYMNYTQKMLFDKPSQKGDQLEAKVFMQYPGELFDMAFAKDDKGNLLQLYLVSEDGILIYLIDGDAVRYKGIITPTSLFTEQNIPQKRPVVRTQFHRLIAKDLDKDGDPELYYYSSDHGNTIGIKPSLSGKSKVFWQVDEILLDAGFIGDKPYVATCANQPGSDYCIDQVNIQDPFAARVIKELNAGLNFEFYSLLLAESPGGKHDLALTETVNDELVIFDTRLKDVYYTIPDCGQGSWVGNIDRDPYLEAFVPSTRIDGTDIMRMIKLYPKSAGIRWTSQEIQGTIRQIKMIDHDQDTKDEIFVLVINENNSIIYRFD